MIAREAGDEIALSYFSARSPAHGWKTTTPSASTALCRWKCMADRTLMPDFPVSRRLKAPANGTRLPADLRDPQKGDDYWKQHRGTPKHSSRSPPARSCVGNRFGNLTAVAFRFQRVRWKTR